MYLIKSGPIVKKEPVSRFINHNSRNLYDSVEYKIPSAVQKQYYNQS